MRVAQVSRLILNLLEADCPLDESMDSMTTEPLTFCHTQSNRDSETDTSQVDRGATSLGEEIHEEARWWIGDLVLSIPVDNVVCRWHTNYCFVYLSSTTWLAVTNWARKLMSKNQEHQTRYTTWSWMTMAQGICSSGQTTHYLYFRSWEWNKSGNQHHRRSMDPGYCVLYIFMFVEQHSWAGKPWIERDMIKNNVWDCLNSMENRRGQVTKYFLRPPILLLCSNHLFFGFITKSFNICFLYFSKKKVNPPLSKNVPSELE